MNKTTPKSATYMRRYADRILQKKEKVEDAINDAVIRGYTREGAVEGLRFWGIKNFVFDV